jgi:hypothetical protein
MSTRNNLLGLIFLVAVLAFALFAAKRLLFQAGPKARDAGALLDKSKLDKSKPVPKPLEPKPSAAVLVPPSPAASSVASSNGQAQASTPAAVGAAAGSRKEPSPAAKRAATATRDHRPEDHRPQLRLEPGIRLWIRVTSINRQPDESFTFRGSLLQPVDLANANQLDQGTEVAGTGTVNNGHVRVLLTAFTVGGANYALLQDDANASNRRPGTGLAVELDPGKLLEVWLASSSVYRKTP